MYQYSTLPYRLSLDKCTNQLAISYQPSNPLHNLVPIFTCTAFTFV